MTMIAVLVFGFMPTTAVLSNAPSPVKIKSCDVAYIDDSTNSGSVMTTSLEFTNGVTLTVANTSAKPVTAFTVAGSYDTFHVTDTWAGKLLPGARVSVYKHYTHFAATMRTPISDATAPRLIVATVPYDGSKAKCSITSATYADGSTWTAPVAPAAQ